MTSLLHLTDVRLGAAVAGCNDEFFGPSAALLRPQPPTRQPGLFTDHGQWVDGWETRRRREPGHDWVTLRLGVPGLIRRVVVDTSYFDGNQPESCLVEGCGEASPGDDPEWFELVSRRPLAPDTVHEFDVTSPYRVTFLRLSVFPDGGVARLRAYGEQVPAPRQLDGQSVELTDVRLGARVDDRSDAHFSDPAHLLLPGPPVSIADGWETRRRRGPGHDWVVIRLAARGQATAAQVDTTFFKGNAPETCWLEGRADPDPEWRTLVPPVALRPHAPHHFVVTDDAPLTHVRLSIEPDGGIARLRVHGTVDVEGAQVVALRWLETLPPRLAVAVFADVCGSQRWAAEMARRRPYASAQAVRDTAALVWTGLNPDDWQQAFAASDPQSDIHVAAAEQQRVTDLRLARLLGADR